MKQLLSPVAFCATLLVVVPVGAHSKKHTEPMKAISWRAIAGRRAIPPGAGRQRRRADPLCSGSVRQGHPF